MSCPAEWTLGVYADDELSGPPLRALESHLVGCEACRRRVLDLQTEARLLADVILDRPMAAEATVVTVSGGTLAAGVPATLGVLGLALGVVTFLFESRIPSGLDWARPARWLGVNEMILDVLFAAREQAPAAVEFALSVAVMVSIAALVTFAAGFLTRKIDDVARLGVVLLCAGVLGTVAPAEAALDQRMDQPVHITSDEVIEETLVVTGDSLILEGTVRGDVLAFCERVSIRGVVEGDVFAIGRDFEHSGRIDGSLHAFGEQGRIEGAVDESLFLGFDRVTISPSATVGRDGAVFGERVVVEGKFGRDLRLAANRSELSGSVGRHMGFWGKEVKLLSGASVASNFTAYAAEESGVVIHEDATIGGERDIHADDPVLQRHLSPYSSPFFYLWRLVWLAAAFGVGLLLHALVPSFFRGVISNGAEFLRTLGFGFAFLVLCPITLVLAALTVVGIPIAVIGAALYALAWYLAGIIVAALIGRAITRPGSDSVRDFGIALLAGLVIVTIAYHLPWVGELMRFIGALLGFGLLVERAMVAWQERSLA